MNKAIEITVEEGEWKGKEKAVKIIGQGKDIIMNFNKEDNNKYKSGAVSDNLLTAAHILFIIFSFVFAYQAPFYLGFLMIILHKSHEIYFGECYLTLLQKRYNYSDQDDDFFYHLFKRLNIKRSRKFTMNIHRAIKIIILIIVVYKMYNYFYV